MVRGDLVWLVNKRWITPIPFLGLDCGPTTMGATHVVCLMDPDQSKYSFPLGFVVKFLYEDAVWNKVAIAEEWL